MCASSQLISVNYSKNRISVPRDLGALLQTVDRNHLLLGQSPSAQVLNKVFFVLGLGHGNKSVCVVPREDVFRRQSRLVPREGRVGHDLDAFLLAKLDCFGLDVQRVHFELVVRWLNFANVK